MQLKIEETILETKENEVIKDSNKRYQKSF